MAAFNERLLLEANLYMVLLLIRRRLRRQHRRRHRFCVREIYRSRQTNGAYNTLVQELRLFDREYFLGKRMKATWVLVVEAIKLLNLFHEFLACSCRCVFDRHICKHRMWREKPVTLASWDRNEALWGRYKAPQDTFRSLWFLVDRWNRTSFYPSDPDCCDRWSRSQPSKQS